MTSQESTFEPILTLEEIINRIFVGNSLRLLKRLPSKSISCVITSPPYWALRDYKTDGEIWDGDPVCEHDFSERMEIKFRHRDKQNSKFFEELEQTERKSDTLEGTSVNSEFCIKCRAWRGELGLEPNFELYLKHLIDIFREVRRVLRDDGVMFVNIGDTFFGGGFGIDEDIDATKQGSNGGTIEGRAHLRSIRKGMKGYPDKCLCLIPERFVVMMRDQVGFLVRGKPIWVKRNAMTSSAKDRPTLDYEPIYMFTKRGNYYFETLFEEYSEATLKMLDEDYKGESSKSYTLDGVESPSDKKRSGIASMKKKRKKNMPKYGGERAGKYDNPTYSGNEFDPTFGRIMRSVWDISTKFYGNEYCPKCDALRDTRKEVIKRCKNCHQFIFKRRKVKVDGSQYDAGLIDDDFEEDMHKRDYCEICKDKYEKEFLCVYCRTEVHSHFAMYPMELAERMLRGGCPEFICNKCDKPLRKVYDEERINTRPGNNTGFGKSCTEDDPNKGLHESDLSRFRQKILRTEGGYEGCECSAGFHPGIVLDPFVGFGTTLEVACMGKRKFVGIDKNPLSARASELRVQPYLLQKKLD